MDTQAVVAQLRQELARLDTAIAALQNLDGSTAPRRGRPPKSAQSGSTPGKRHMSASARAKIAAAQRARWAKQKGQAPTSATVTRTKRRGISPAGRKRLDAGFG